MNYLLGLLPCGFTVGDLTPIEGTELVLGNGEGWTAHMGSDGSSFRPVFLERRIGRNRAEVIQVISFEPVAPQPFLTFPPHKAEEVGRAAIMGLRASYMGTFSYMQLWSSLGARYTTPERKSAAMTLFLEQEGDDPLEYFDGD